MTIDRKKLVWAALLLLCVLPLLDTGLFRALVPTSISPTISRSLYFKLPLEGVRFHWRFLDRAALLDGELTLRIVNARHHRDQTFVVFRDGAITDGWHMIGGAADSAFYFGLSSSFRVPTARDDSLIITLVARHDLEGEGPFTTGTLHAGTWQATGTYSDLSGNPLNPAQLFTSALRTPIASMECWSVAWPLTTTSDRGWYGSADEERRANWVNDLFRKRGVDGRRCVSHRPPPRIATR